MNFIQVLIITSLYFVLGGTIIFLALIVVPSIVKGVRTLWINRNVTDSKMEDEYNITFQSVKDQYQTVNQIEDVYSTISDNQK